MQFGSLMNTLAAGARSQHPEVGMGATMLAWSDRHAATIVAASESGRSVGVQRDIARRIDSLGMTDSGQRYEYSPDPTAAVSTYTLRRNGRWVSKGAPMRSGSVLVIGYRDEFYDFSF